MGLWDTLRTAYNLARRVEETERAVARVVQEWGDTLDILRAREERQRKRDQRAVRASVESTGGPCRDCGPDVAAAEAEAETLAARKQQLRKRVARVRLPIPTEEQTG